MPATFTSSSQAQLDELAHFSSLLHLFHHRNKNQHRRSLWYRHFSIFHRQLSKLQDLCITAAALPATHMERAKHRARLPDLQTRITQTLDVWQDVLVPKWTHAFGQLIADGQFAVLGMVLTAVLAGVCGTLGINARLEKDAIAVEEAEQAEMVKALQAFEREVWDGARLRNASISGEDLGTAATVIPNDDDDLGVPLERSSDTALALDPTANHMADSSFERRAPVASLQFPASEATSMKTNKVPSHIRSIKKKRKRGDAIDDLFGSL